MAGSIPIPTDRLSATPPIHRLAEALRAETVDSVSLCGDRIDVRIDGTTKLRPGGDSWMFNLWTGGYFIVADEGAAIAVKFQLRTDRAALALIAGMIMLAIVGLAMAIPALVFAPSIFVMLVILSVLWTRYISLPRWVRRVLTSSQLPAPKRLCKLSEGAG